MKITLIEITNLKRLKAVRLVPTEKGLTVIGGRNGQGKTSVLDAIAFALGGEKYRPSSLKRDGAIAETRIHIELDNGLVIDRKGKNSDLTVYDETGKKQGQRLIDSLISRLAIDLPKFLNETDREKADTLLQILGIGEQLDAIDRNIKAKYDTRTVIGRQADQKKKAAEDMPYHEGLPDAPVSVAELIKQQKEVLARNGLRDEHRRNKKELTASLLDKQSRLKDLQAQIDDIEAKLRLAEDAVEEDGENEDTSELEKQIADFEATNLKIAENKAKLDRENEATDLQDQYDALTEEIDELRKSRLDLLKNAKLPFPGLSVNDDGCLTLNGKAWDCMSGSQQMIVGSAIAARLNPECKFVLLDKLEQLDLETLKEFGEWLEKNDLQALATRVSTNSDGECSLVIEDGEVVGADEAPVIALAQKPEPAKPETDYGDWD